MNKKGSTLIELIVSLSSFMIIIATVTSLIFMYYKVEKNNIYEDFSYVNNLIIKDLSKAKEITVDPNKKITIVVYNNDGSTSTIVYQNKDGKFYRNQQLVSETKKLFHNFQDGFIIKFNSFEKYYKSPLTN